jgi:large subunit ribosomal protein L22
MATQPITTPAPAIESQAQLRFLRMSPQKARLVVDLIRGRRAAEALQILRFTKKRAAHDVEKLLRSAIANAERRAEEAGEPLDVDHLYVSRCFVNEGPRWKRIRPAPMGRAYRYQRRTSHILIAVAEHHEAAARRVATLAARTEEEKGVRGVVRKARKALAGKKPVQKKKRK